MSTLAHVLVVVATPVLAFAGAMIGHWAHRRAATELDKWRRREETLRTMRWAAEQACSVNQREQAVGGVVLTELLDSELLQLEDSEMVEEVLAAIAFDQETQSTYAEGVSIVKDGS